MKPKEISEKLERMLRLSTHPVGVILYENKADLPREPMKFKLNICQLVSMARYQGRIRAGVPEGMVCSLGAACTGLIKTPKVLLSGAAEVGKHAKNKTAAENYMNNTFKLGDSGKHYEAILASPLYRMDSEPDVVVLYGNPAQMTRIIHACVYDTGNKMKADTVAEATLCSAIGSAISKNKPLVGFPCSGERIFGGTQDSEMVFVAPYNYVKFFLIENLWHTEKKGFSVYPVPPNTVWTPIMPQNYTIQPEDLMEDVLF